MTLSDLFVVDDGRRIWARMHNLSAGLSIRDANEYDAVNTDDPVTTANIDVRESVDLGQKLTDNAGVVWSVIGIDSPDSRYGASIRLTVQKEVIVYKGGTA